MAKGQKRAMLYRAVRFEIFPTEAQEHLLRQVSENLRIVWNTALGVWMQAFSLWKQEKMLQKNDMQKPVAIASNEKAPPITVKSPTLSVAIAHNEKLTPIAVKFPTLFDQINQLTGARAQDKTFASTPRNWQEETLDRLDGSFKSFFALAKNGDKDARPPRTRSPGFFQVIPGRSSFSVQGNIVCFAPNLFGKGALTFTIPEYCVKKLQSGTVKKFTLSRTEHELAKAGSYFLSIVYEIPQPEVVAFDKKELVYLALGASSLVICTASGDQVIDF